MADQPHSEVVRVERAALRAVRFRDERSRAPSPWEGPVLDLLGASHLTRIEKKGTPAFSTVVYEEGATRGKRGIRCATALVLDFDHLAAAVAEQMWQKLRARGWAFAACTSFSHHAEGADDHCFRVVVLVSRPILPDEYESVWLAANAALGRVADANARDISRLMSRAFASATRPSAALAASQTDSYSSGRIGRDTRTTTRKQWSSAPSA